MKKFKIIVTFYACIIVQVQLSRLIPFFRDVPLQLLLISLIYFCLDFDWFAGLLFGALAGALFDLLSGGILGAYALSYGIIGLFVGAIQPMIFKEELLPRVFLIFVGTIALQFINYQVIRTHQPDMQFLHNLLKSILPGAVLNCAVAAPFLFIIQNRVKEKASWNRDRRRA
jgi:rod shape-determining protein MreD